MSDLYDDIEFTLNERFKVIKKEEVKNAAIEICKKIRKYDLASLDIGDEIYAFDVALGPSTAIVLCKPTINSDVIYVLNDRGAVFPIGPGIYKKTGKHYPYIKDMIDCLKGSNERIIKELKSKND